MIRIAAEEDLPACLEIYAPFVEHTTVTFEYTVPTMAEFTQRFRKITARFPWLVWEEDGRVLGYAYASAPYSRAAFAWTSEPSIYLTAQAQGRGIGRRLYDALEKILAFQGFQVSYALITGENETSIAFHKACGYEIKASYESCGFKFGRWLGLVWMEKRLKSVEIPSSVPIPWENVVQDSQRKTNILGILSLS